MAQLELCPIFDGTRPCHHSPPLAHPRPRLSPLARCRSRRRPRPRPSPPSSADGLQPVSVSEVVPTAAPTAGSAPSSLPSDPMGQPNSAHIRPVRQERRGAGARSMTLSLLPIPIVDPFFLKMIAQNPPNCVSSTTTLCDDLTFRRVTTAPPSPPPEFCLAP